MSCSLLDPGILSRYVPLIVLLTCLLSNAPIYPSSVINSISPNFGLVQGGATVTISGNFIVGSEDTTFDLSCKFGDVITDAVLVNR